MELFKETHLFISCTLLLLASSDNVARLWNVNSGEVIREYVGHQKAVTCVAFRDIISPD